MVIQGLFTVIYLLFMPHFLTACVYSFDIDLI